tara:strand:- start:3296 stop:3520 length:225 start_codon:yes stop_codon:yes gene_type:complete
MSIEIIAAKMQRQIKDLEHDQKIKRNMLLERDEEITNLKKELDKKQQLIDFLNKQLMEERKDNEKTRKNIRRKK